MKNLPLINITDCFSKKDIVIKLNLPQKGNSYKIIEEYIITNNLDTLHFDQKRSKEFTLKLLKFVQCVRMNLWHYNGSKKEKITCSYSCSNTHFRSGVNDPNYKTGDNYRTKCFLYHKKECIICGENKIVAVHHYDENHDNNEIDNLIPLCPTHHQYVHSRYKDEVLDKIKLYITEFKRSTIPD